MHTGSPRRIHAARRAACRPTIAAPVRTLEDGRPHRIVLFVRIERESDRRRMRRGDSAHDRGHEKTPRVDFTGAGRARTLIASEAWMVAGLTSS